MIELESEHSYFPSSECLDKFLYLYILMCILKPSFCFPGFSYTKGSESCHLV